MPDKAMKVAFAGCVAIIFSGAPIFIYTQSLFVVPVTQEFGWSRSQYFAPLSIAGLLGAVSPPVVGYLADRYGTRTLLLPGIVLFGLSAAGFGLLDGSHVFYTVLVISLIFSSGIHSIHLYAKAVALWPSRRPALMLAITFAGTAVGGIMMPPLTAYLIETLGWRATRIVLGLAVLAIAFPVVWAFVKAPASLRRTSARPLVAGTPGSQAIRSATFWLITLAITLSGSAINALLANVFPLLRAQGFSAAASASALSVVAGAQLVSRFGSALLLDRLNTPKVGVPLLLCAFVGMAITASTSSYLPMLMGMALTGIGLGAEMELAAYFTRRYFGLKNYAQIYGYILGMFTLGVTSGPLLFAVTYDMTHEYTGAIVIAVGMVAVAMAMLLALSPYRYGADGRSLEVPSEPQENGS